MLFEKQLAVREALCDSFNTPKAIQELSEVIGAMNIYLAQPADQIRVPLVRQISKFVFHVMKCFGVYEESDFPSISSGGEEGGQSHEDTITPVVNALVKFRDQVKANAGDGGKALFQLCDQLRDDVLPYLGIQLEDKGKDEASIWKLEDKEVMIAKLLSKQAEKKKKEEEKAAREALALKKKSTSGKDWFKAFEAEKYSKFDEETGMPSHDASGKALSEAIQNKLKKIQNKQQGVYDKWLES
jgi:cysteinyl-tRNA synthetase